MSGERRLVQIDGEAELLAARLEGMAARVEDLGNQYEALARTMGALGADITGTAEVLGRMIEQLGELRRELR